MSEPNISEEYIETARLRLEKANGFGEIYELIKDTETFSGGATSGYASAFG